MYAWWRDIRLLRWRMNSRRSLAVTINGAEHSHRGLKGKMMDRRQFATRSLAAAAGAVLHRGSSYAAAPLSVDQVPGAVPCRTSFSDFLKAAHTLALAQAEAHRAVKAA